MKKLAKVLCVVLSVVLVGSVFAACGNKELVIPTAKLGEKQATYNTFTGVMPSNWNELTYEDANDSQIMDYISSLLFEFDYEFDESKGGKYKDNTVNVDAIVKDGFTINFSAATKLEDVTKTVDEKWGYTADQKNAGGYAWKITLRNDLKWDDGTKIDATDFVYSMQEMLNPLFLNYRANTYYERLAIIGAKAYFDSKFSSLAGAGYTSIAEAIAAGAKLYIDVWNTFGMTGAPKLSDFDEEATTYDGAFTFDESAPTMAQWVSIDNEDLYLDPAIGSYVKADGSFDTEAMEADEVTSADFVVSAKMIFQMMYNYVDVGRPYANYLRVEVNKGAIDFASTVGIYATDSNNAIVICFEKPLELLEEDGSLSWRAGYYMQSLPLVKKSLYESCKKEPVAGTTLWTSNYNSSLATTASFGPYKLTSFQGGKSYTLEKNENWYGYNMDLYKHQYNVTKIACEQIAEGSTAWMAFLNGTVDEAGLDNDHVADYRNSKYTTYAPGTGTFGMQLFSDLERLQTAKRNNGILAIKDFREAFSLSLNRSDIVDKVWPGSSVVCYGAMNSMYYIDITNGIKYRETEQAKKALLRVYGFTETDGKWSNGAEITNATLEDAYAAMTGYNPALAKEKLKAAITELTTNAEKYKYDANKDITFVFGTSIDNKRNRDRADYLQNILNDLTKGTELQGKIKVTFDASSGSDWANAFKAGSYEIAFGTGFSGNALDPCDMIGAFVDPDDGLNYHSYWNTNTVTMTLKLPAGSFDAAGTSLTMSIKNWYDCLNGNAEKNQQTYKYNWSAGKAPDSVRLEILAALEEQVLNQYMSIMLIGEYNGSLLGAKFSYLTYEYNNFMGYGGLRYMVVNCTDSEWSKVVSDAKNDLTSVYKKTA